MQDAEARTFTRAKGAFGIVLAQELERKVDQFDVVRRHLDHRTFAVPGAKYHTPCGLAVGLQFMDRRAMGMAVDQPLHMMSFHDVNYRLWDSHP